MTNSADTYRNPNAERTETLVDAITALRGVDFHDRYMGSAIRISLRALDGKPLLAEFVVAGEDMELIKVEIIESLQNSLKLRKLLLLREIKEIEEVLS
jgi:hypothetical protein